MIQYRPGKLGAKRDALTRRSGGIPSKVEDDRLPQQNQVLLGPQNLDQRMAVPTPEALASQAKQHQILAGYLSPSTEPESKSLEELFDEAYDHDPFYREILQMLQNGTQRSNDITTSECEEIEGRLYYNNKIHVPDRDASRIIILHQHRDDPAAGHPGRAKTLDLLSETYH